MGSYATGVTVVTSKNGNAEPVGMAVNSFTSVSLTPPLVLICPGKKSETWPSIREVCSFAVNILAAGQEELCRQFAQKGLNRFEDVEYVDGANGSPLLTSASTAALECSIDDEIDAGDHTVVIATVTSLHRFGDTPPLIFFRGSFSELPPAV